MKTNILRIYYKGCKWSSSADTNILVEKLFIKALYEIVKKSDEKQYYTLRYEENETVSELTESTKINHMSLIENLKYKASLKNKGLDFKIFEIMKTYPEYERITK